MEGRLKQALRVRTTLQKLEPFVPIYNVFTALVMEINGDVAGAIALLDRLPAEGAGAVVAQRNVFLALAYASQDRFAFAADALLKISPDQVFVSMPAVKEAAAIIAKAPARIGAPNATLVSQSPLSFVYGFVGAPERVVDYMQAKVAADAWNNAFSISMWHPSLSMVRKSNAFKAVVRKGGSSITGANAAGRICAIPSAPATSRAIEGRATRIAYTLDLRRRRAGIISA